MHLVRCTCPVASCLALYCLVTGALLPVSACMQLRRDADIAGILLTVHGQHSRRVQVGMPEVNDLVGATLNYKLKVAQGNVRKFLASATEGVQLGAYSDVVDKILAAVDEIEKKTGAPLDEANKEGWKALTTKVEVSQAHMSAACT